VPVIADTVYPRMPAEPRPAELEAFTPEAAELAFARRRTRQPEPRLALLVLLKAFQRLGYVVRIGCRHQILTRSQRGVGRPARRHCPFLDQSGDSACSHFPMATGSQAARWVPFTWVNTALGNIKAAIMGTYHHVSAKHAQRYLASVA
jgi:hypothetical protein